PVVNIAVPGPICIDNTNPNIVLTPSTGGTLTGTGVTNNVFNPAVAGVGPHTLVYEVTDQNGCYNSTTNDVEVVQAAPPTLTGPTDACVDAPAVTFTVTPTTGILLVSGNPTNTTF